MPKTDDNIDTVLGLAVFYQHVRMVALNQQQQTHVTVFTTELFAHYLHIKCLSVTKCQQLSDTTISQSSSYEVQSYAKNIADTQQLFIADVLVWKLISIFAGNKFVYKQHSSGHQSRPKYSNELNTSYLVELLQKFAVRHLTTLRQIEARDFGSVASIVTTEFEALYAYKRGDYQMCLHLSIRNVRRLLYAEYMIHVPMYPEFVQLLDDDIVSLIALTSLVNPECRDSHPFVVITQLTLSLYLMAQCQLKLRHPVTCLTETHSHIKVAQRRCPFLFTLERLVLKMIAQKTLTYIKTIRQ